MSSDETGDASPSATPLSTHSHSHSEAAAAAPETLSLSFIFRKIVGWFFYLTLVLATLEVAKMVAVYCGCRLHANENTIYGKDESSWFWHFLNFVRMPEGSAVTANAIFVFLDYWRLVVGLLIYSLILVVYAKTEKLYFKSVEERPEDVQLFLFTLSVSGFTSLEEAESFVDVVRLQHPTDDIVIDVVYVYNLDDYRKARHAQVLRDDRFGAQRGDAEAEVVQAQRTAGEFADVEEPIPSILSAEQLLRAKSVFTGKLFIELNDLHVIRNVLQLTQTGTFLNKVKSDVERAVEYELVSAEEAQRMVALASVYLKRLKIEVAHDANDINFKNIESDTPLLNAFKFALCLLIIVLFIGATIVIKYFATYRDLQVQYGLIAAEFTIPRALGGYKVSMAYVGLTVALVLLPLVGTLVIQVIVSKIKFHLYSSAINASFWLETMYQVLYQFLAVYVGYRYAVFSFKSGMDTSQLTSLYYLTNGDFYFTVVMFKVGIWVRYGGIKLWKAVLRWRNRKNVQGKSLVNSQETESKMEIVQHSFFAVNIVVSFFCLFFYQYLMSPVVLVALAASLGLNLCAFSAELRSAQQRVHLSFGHLSSLICFVIVASSTGGMLSMVTHFDFAFRYFCLPGYADSYFPIASIAAGGVLLVYCPVLVKLRSHSSFSVRVMDYVIDRQIHVRLMETVEEETRNSGFKSFNSWDKERADIAAKLIL